MSQSGNAPRWRRYLRFIRPDPVSDVADELAFHIAMRIERNIALGMSPDEAHRDAERRFGDVARWRDQLIEHDQQEQRSATRQEIMSDFLQDLRYALRSLARAPGMTAAVIVTLALGLGVNMAMFSFLDVVFFRYPTSVHQPEQVRRLWTWIDFRNGAQFWSGYSYPQYAAVRSAIGEQATLTIYATPRLRRFRHSSEEIQAAVSMVEASYFPFLGVRPRLGRFFATDEDSLGNAAHVAVLSQAFWRRELGAMSDVIGRDVRINGQPYTVIGVAQEGFTGVELDRTDVWVPLATHANFDGTPWWLTNRVNGFQVLLRSRRTGAALHALAERAETGLRAPEALLVPSDTVNDVALGSIIRERGPGQKDGEVIVATRVAWVTAIVLLIACANVINLLLARAVRRRREIAVRLAMGISRLRLARLLLTESILLALFAAAAAVIAAHWGGQLLRTMLMPDVVWAYESGEMSWRVLAGAVFLGLVAGVIAGIAPIAQSMRTAVTGALKAGTGTSEEGRRSPVRDWLVVAQVALSVMLLAGAALFVSSLRNVHAVRTGYDTALLVYSGIDFDTRDSVRDALEPQRLRDVAQRLRGSRLIAQVALTRMAPTRGFSFMTHHPDVDTIQYRKPFAPFSLVSSEFFSATGMRILRGESFPHAPAEAMPPVVVINEAFAQAQWPGMEPIGRCLRFPPEDVCYRVIGVVETAMFDRLIEEPTPQYYLPLDNPPREAGTSFGTLVVRARTGARDRVIAEVRRSLQETFPGGRVNIRTMEQIMEPQFRPWRLGATLFSAFGVLALVVAALGIYSTIAYTVAQRTHEFGVRTALGAQTRDILRQVVGSSIRIVIVGVVLGVALALAAGRFIAALLYAIEPSDPGVMIAVSLVLVLIAIVAALGPAWRAARVNPVVALRTE